MRGFALLQTAAILACAIRSTDGTREVWAWVTSGSAEAAAAQWNNWTVNHAPIFDGVQASCGVTFDKDGTFKINETTYALCKPIIDAVHSTGGKVEAWVGAVPDAAIHNFGLAFDSVSLILDNYDFDGISLDDEFDCAPRSTLDRFSEWSGFTNQLADWIHSRHEGTLSAAVQAMFGIQDVPYAPLCDPPEAPQCSQACSKAPWEYEPHPAVSAMMNNASMDRWLEMDTYYFSTNRFLDTLSYYSQTVHSDKLGVAVMNRDDITDDGMAARFYALEKSGANWLNIFLLPANDAWLPWVQKWKSQCGACPNAGVLSCYETGLDCSGN